MANLNCGKHTAQLIHNSQYSLDAVMKLWNVNLLQLHLLAACKHMRGTGKLHLCDPRRNCVTSGLPAEICILQNSKESNALKSTTQALLFCR
jgi:hypothetical protein